MSLGHEEVEPPVRMDQQWDVISEPSDIGRVIEEQLCTRSRPGDASRLSDLEGLEGRRGEASLLRLQEANPFKHLAVPGGQTDENRNVTIEVLAGPAKLVCLSSELARAVKTHDVCSIQRGANSGQEAVGDVIFVPTERSSCANYRTDDLLKLQDEIRKDHARHHICRSNVFGERRVPQRPSQPKG